MFHSLRLHKHIKLEEIKKKFIMLLNCLNKVAEKIIAVQLSYTAEINNKLLNFGQMKDRKQRSTINAVLNLVHDA